MPIMMLLAILAEGGKRHACRVEVGDIQPMSAGTELLRIPRRIHRRRRPRNRGRWVHAHRSAVALLPEAEGGYSKIASHRTATLSMKSCGQPFLVGGERIVSGIR